jgi:biotin operon repressor
MKSSNRTRYFTSTEAAKELGITRAAIHRAIKQGRLEAERGEIIKIVQTKTSGWKISAPTLNSYRVSLLHQWVGKKIA